MEGQDIRWLKKNVCKPHNVFCGEQVPATIKVIARHYKDKHRIDDPYSTVCKMRELREKKKQKHKNELEKKQQKSKKDNHEGILRTTGGVLEDGSRWGDALFIEEGRCCGCNQQTSHKCQEHGCTISVCNRCYGWCEDMDDLRCWHHLSQETREDLSQQILDDADEEAKMGELTEQHSSDDLFDEDYLKQLELWDQVTQSTAEQDMFFILSKVQQFLEDPIILPEDVSQDEHDDVEMIGIDEDQDNLELGMQSFRYLDDGLEERDSDNDVILQGMSITPQEWLDPNHNHNHNHNHNKLPRKVKD